jgi:hypothetical protein
MLGVKEGIVNHGIKSNSIFRRVGFTVPRMLILIRLHKAKRRRKELSASGPMMKSPPFWIVPSTLSLQLNYLRYSAITITSNPKAMLIPLK